MSSITEAFVIMSGTKDGTAPLLSKAVGHGILSEIDGSPSFIFLSLEDAQQYYNALGFSESFNIYKIHVEVFPEKCPTTKQTSS